MRLETIHETIDNKSELEKLELELLKLTNKALKAFPNSKIQKDLRTQINQLYDKIEKIKNSAINEAMSPNYKKWRKANVTYRGTGEDNPWPLDGINEYEGKFGYGLYTTPLSNKAMTRGYGKTWLIVGAIPKNPIKFKSINTAEMWFQNYAIKNGKGKDDIEKLRNFWKKTSIDKEMVKHGYDGVEIVGREMVLFNPNKDKLRAFETERQLEMWYDDFFEEDTGPIEWDESGIVPVPRKSNDKKKSKAIHENMSKSNDGIVWLYGQTEHADNIYISVAVQSKNKKPLIVASVYGDDAEEILPFKKSRADSPIEWLGIDEDYYPKLVERANNLLNGVDLNKNVLRPDKE